MRLALIAHGAMPIPPKGWGAVEGIIWNWKLYLERAGHSVDIFNTRCIHSVIYDINHGDYHFAHCHNEAFVLDCVAHLNVPFAATNHTVLKRLSSGDYEYAGAAQYQFKSMLQAPANIVLSEKIKGIYLRNGYQGFLRVLRNAVATENFRVHNRGNGKAICLGRIARRKRQHWLSEIARDRVAIDFVGPWDRETATEFKEHQMAKYLGAWDRQTLYDRLSDYSCLALLSGSEAAAPLVVLEAFAAGLSVVISEACAENLIDKEFITIIPDHEKNPVVISQAIHAAIEKNASLRPEICSYALEHFDYNVLCQEYLHIIEEIREHFRHRAGGKR